MIENREKLILCGLFLSKFDKLAYQKLGFKSFSEAFNVLGYALNGKPMNIKNYRDEFDPYFDNNRKGWHNREIRAYCKDVYDKYNKLNLENFSQLISSFLVKDYEIKTKINHFLNIENEPIKRIATGKAAENYFIENYIKHFRKFSLIDTREFGCGFDFKLEYEQQFFCIEVKGISQNSGNILLTQKEFEIANKFQDKYCLFIVKNLQDKPCESLFFNPLQKVNLKQKEITQITYQGYIE